MPMDSDWNKRLLQEFERLVRVRSADQGTADRGRMLNILLMLVALLTAITAISALLVDHSVTLLATLVFLSAILPPYLLSKRGRVRTAMQYYLTANSVLTVLSTLQFSRQVGSEAAVQNAMYTLIASVLVAALVRSPRAGIFMGAVNGILCLIIYVTWFQFSPRLVDPVHIFLTLVFPIAFQWVFALLCTLLVSQADRNRRAMIDANSRQARQLQLLRAVLDNLPIGVAVLDVATLKPSFQNEILKELIGPIEDLGRTGWVRIAQPPIEEESLVERREAVPIRENELPWEAAARLDLPLLSTGDTEIRGSRAPVTVQEKVVRVIGENRAPLYYIYFATDVTAYRTLAQKASEYLTHIVQQNRRLKELDLLKSEFIANMSHELRTPLTTIIGRAELLLRSRTYPLPEQPLRDVKAIANAGDHLSKLITDILDMAKIDAQRMTLDRQRFDLREPITEVTRDMEILAEKKGLALHFERPAEAVWVLADRVRIKQIIYNLLSNAVKFTDHGSVQVTVYTTDNQVRVTVVDTGPGIPPEYLEAVFDRFQRIENLGKSRKGGTGIGLTIARRLAELHSGSLRAESTVGKGSSFTVSLPPAPQIPPMAEPPGH
jgi:signal transduction histidine kinase